MAAQTPAGPGAFMSDRDNRRLGDRLHPVAGELDSDEDWRNAETPPLGNPTKRRRTDPVEVDESAFAPDVRWREFDEIRDEVRLCKAERLKAKRWQVWKRVGGGVSVAGVLTVGAFVVRALLAAGESAEAARAETAALRDVVSRTREIENKQSAHSALLDILTRTVFAPRP